MVTKNSPQSHGKPPGFVLGFFFVILSLSSVCDYIYTRVVVVVCYIWEVRTIGHTVANCKQTALRWRSLSRFFYYFCFAWSTSSLEEYQMVIRWLLTREIYFFFIVQTSCGEFKLSWWIFKLTVNLFMINFKKMSDFLWEKQHFDLKRFSLKLILNKINL